MIIDSSLSLMTELAWPYQNLYDDLQVGKGGLPPLERGQRD
ncbi:MAG: hypothetical protein QOF62_2785 [Pyrinomonadaceae bacterium]|jgi:hypothetical protein|nr:hypothetical protein [Pyrinomonadaceae bacterium]